MFSAKPKKKAGAKKKDSDSEDDMFSAKSKKKTGGAKKAAKGSDSDMDFELGDDSFEPKRAGGGRAKKPVKYDFDSGSDMSD